jgi:Ca2+-transporting ATPase
MPEERLEKLTPWHAQSPKDCLAALDSSVSGLPEIEVKKRWLEDGKNQLPKPSPTPAWRILLNQFLSPLMLILLIAALLSALLYEWLDVYVIATAIFINSILGFIEEFQADRSWRALSAYLPDLAKVRRAGIDQAIAAVDVVPGDILILKAGDRITADARLIEQYALETNEAALTGESSTVAKSSRAVDRKTPVADRRSMVYAGTLVAAGRGLAVVVATGERTELGQISHLVGAVENTSTPLEMKLARFSRQLSWIIVVFTSLVFVIGLWRGYAANEMFRISAALAVSAVPEGLLVAFTVILAIGLKRILRHQGLVRKLLSAETLGSVSVLCVDKTGTLTTGEMTLDQIRLGQEIVPLHLVGRRDLDELRLVLALTHGATVERNAQSDSDHWSGTLTDVAIARYLEPYTASLPLDNYKLVSELPFDSEQKYAARVFDSGGKSLITVFGAPEVLLSRLNHSDKLRTQARNTFEAMASEGLRVLLVARVFGKFDGELKPEDVTDLELVGLIGLRDPIRSEVGNFVATAKAAGIRPVMITGDHPETAFAVAKQVGIATSTADLITGAQLDELTDAQLEERINSITVFARTVPEQKLRIVEAWRRLGAVVAMTGDGVNDAPAIKAAHIGIALGTATTVAKETADLVLLDNSFKTIILSVREGRVIFDNLRKTFVYLLAASFSEIILVGGALLMNLPLPLLPAQILWINLITDGLPSVALSFEPAEKNIMKDQPRALREPIMSPPMRRQIFVIGLITDLGLFAVYLFLLGRGFPIDEIRTFIFMALGLNSLLYVFAVRKIRQHIWQGNPFENKWLLFAVLIGLGLQFTPLLVPSIRELFNFVVLSWQEVAMVFGLALFKLLLIELAKQPGLVSQKAL